MNVDKVDAASNNEVPLQADGEVFIRSFSGDDGQVQPVRKVIIGISGKKGGGKTSLCRHIEDRSIYTVEKHPLAEPLKRICVEVLGLEERQVYGTEEDKNRLTQYCWDDLPHYRELLEQALWEEERRAHAEWARLSWWQRLCRWAMGHSPQRDAHREAMRKLPRGPMTARQVMQQVGTMFRLFDEDVWAKACVRAIQASRAAVCLVDDVRYPNEVEILRGAGARVLRLTRSPNGGDLHDSEVSLDHYRGFDGVVENGRMTLEESKEALEAELRRLGLDREMGL